MDSLLCESNKWILEAESHSMVDIISIEAVGIGVLSSAGEVVANGWTAQFRYGLQTCTFEDIILVSRRCEFRTRVKLR